MFDDFCARYLHDGHPPEYVEQRAQQLQELLEQHVARVRTAVRDESVEELLAAYQRQRLVILEAKDIDDELKDSLLVSLRGQYYEKLQRLTGDA
jgi:hypothetical protein